MKKQSKKWMLVALALLAMVALPLVGCKNDSVAEPEQPTPEQPTPEQPGGTGSGTQTPPADENVTEKFTVTFSKGENTEFTGTVPVDITVDSGTKLTADQLKALADTAKFSFDGWYDGNTKAESGYTVTKTVSLTAKWKLKKYTITFNSDGGSTVQRQTVESGKTATEPSPVPTKTGYTLDGWYSNSDLTKPYNFSSPVTSSFPLYAKWTPNTVGIQVELPKNPQAGSLTENEYTFTANFDEKTYLSYTWFVDGEKQENQSGATFSWNTSTVAAGWHEIRVEVEDNDARIGVEVKK